MNFTTTTKLARNGKKEFDHGIQVVLYNNEDIGLIVGTDVYKAMRDSGLIDQIREEMREANDPTTVCLIERHRAGDRTDAIDFDQFTKNHNL